MGDQQPLFGRDQQRDRRRVDRRRQIEVHRHQHHRCDRLRVLHRLLQRRDRRGRCGARGRAGHHSLDDIPRARQRRPGTAVRHRGHRRPIEQLCRRDRELFARRLCHPLHIQRGLHLQSGGVDDLHHRRQEYRFQQDCVHGGAGVDRRRHGQDGHIRRRAVRACEDRSQIQRTQKRRHRRLGE